VNVLVCVYYLTAVPITKAVRVGRGITIVEDMCYERLVSRLGIEPKTPGWLVQDPTTSPAGIWSPPMSVFITAVPSIKLFAWGQGDSGGHMLREMTSRGLCGLVCPSRTRERAGGRDCVKEGGGEEGERESRERALGLLLCHSSRHLG
jgi:hypothetical protein